jgi:outer membrane protein with beta-barrel domain
MNTTAKLLALVALLATPALAFAQPYANFQLGYARADFPIGPPYNGVVKDNAPMVGIEAGYAFRKWGAEVGFNDYGSLDGFGTPCLSVVACTSTTREIDGNDQTLYKLALVRRFEIGNVRLFGKAGYYRAHLKTNIPEADFHPDGFMLGLGARWYFSSPWSLAIEGERFDDNVSQVSLGIGWGFGRGDRDSSEYREGYRDAERDAGRD